MAENLIPPESSQHSDGNNHPDDGTGHSNNDNLSDGLEILGGIIFAVVGVGFSDAGLHIWAFLFYFLSVGCGIWVITHYIKKSGSKRVWKWFCSLIFVDFILFSFLSWHTFSTENPAKSKSYPHLQIGLALSNTNFLWLTNDCLGVASLSGNGEWQEDVGLSNSGPFLVIPLLPTQTNIVFFPLLRNVNGADAEKVLVQIVFNADIDVSAETDWTVNSEMEQNEKSLLIRDITVPHNRSFTLPRITVNGGLLGVKWGMARSPVVIRVESKNAPILRLSFWMVEARFPIEQANQKIAIYRSDQIEYKTNGVIQFNSKSQMGTPH
jgi:hypothetical protein